MTPRTNTTKKVSESEKKFTRRNRVEKKSREGKKKNAMQKTEDYYMHDGKFIHVEICKDGKYLINSTGRDS